MGFAVKITTLKNLFNLICPYTCRGCGRVGTPICRCCKNYSIYHNFNFCPHCFAEIDYFCPDCNLPFTAHFVCGWRDELLGQLVEEYKFNAARDFADDLAEILDHCLPVLLGDIAVVPLPTIARHIRERGFDHTRRLADALARRRGWQVAPALTRAKNTVQVGTGREQRLIQAAQAYQLNPECPIQPNLTYLLLDDVWTTGATLLAAANVMLAGGAQNLMAAVLVVSGQHESVQPGR